MILVDYSQLAIAGCFAFQSDFKEGADKGKMLDIIRHSFLMSVLSYKQQHSKKYGEIVFACDGNDYWRKGVFEHYKAHRKKNREESSLDWDAIFKHISTLQEDLKKVFPWRVISVSRAEGDDVIGVLTKYALARESEDVGGFKVGGSTLFSEPEPVLIISSDDDFRQLHDLGPVKQFSPMRKKWVTAAEKDFLIEKIIRGDGGDGVPSVLCADDFYVDENSGRAKPVTKAVVSRFKSAVGLSEEEIRRYERNRQLIDFDYIPKDIQDEIIRAYENTTPKTDLNGIMEYLMSKRARLLLNRLQDFR